MAVKQLIFVTGNQNKLSEVKAILGDVVDLQSQALDLVEIQGTIEEISADKCRRAAEAVSDLNPWLALDLRAPLISNRSMVQSWLRIPACASMR